MCATSLEPPVFSAYTPEAHDFFLTYGYVAVHSGCDDAGVADLRDRVVALAERENAAGEACFYENRPSECGNIRTDSKLLQRVWNILNKESAFHTIPLSALHEEAMTCIFQRPTNRPLYQISSFQANILHPGAAVQKIHIDTPVPEPLPDWPIKANTILLLDDFTTNNGATLVVPGSHKNKRKPRPGTADEDLLQTLLAPAGTTLITHGALWHASGRNNSSRSRIVILGSYAATYASEIAFEEHQQMIRNPDMAISPELAKLMGLTPEPKPGALVF